MISKAKIKFIRSLEQKKFRKQENAFVAEGPKVVGDLLDASIRQPKIIAGLPEWLDANISRIPEGTEVCEVTPEELQKISFLQHPQQVLAVFPIRENNPAEITNLTLALDGVQDPGNLGTIIRTADWFGITDIYCSKDSADCYNPKVVQATMGSLARVNIHYVDLPEYLSTLPETTPIYGTFLDGEDMTSCFLPPLGRAGVGVIIMGNEGNGISKEVEQYVNHRLLIPNYPKGRPTAESLNVAIATAIMCFFFRANTHPSPPQPTVDGRRESQGRE